MRQSNLELKFTAESKSHLRWLVESSTQGIKRLSAPSQVSLTLGFNPGLC
jgi:hypothetical protein